MCGIFVQLCSNREGGGCSDCRGNDTTLTAMTRSLMNRGPDVKGKRVRNTSVVEKNQAIKSVTMVGNVLWMQGSIPQPQPIEDERGNLLLWNGDIFDKAAEEILDLEHQTTLDDDLATPSDTLDVSQHLLLDLMSHSGRHGQQPWNPGRILSQIRGPFAFAYFCPEKAKVWFGRDLLGRHSLLIGRRKTGLFKCLFVSSVGFDSSDDGPSGSSFEFHEVPCKGIYELDLSKVLDDLPGFFERPSFTWAADRILGTINSTQFDLNIMTDDSEDPCCLMERLLEGSPEFSEAVDNLLAILSKSVRKRVLNQPRLCKDCCKMVLSKENDGPSKKPLCSHSKVAVLFSGGLDSLVLAALADREMPENEEDPLDLINVAFGNPAERPTPYEEAPDRKTGLTAFEELQSLAAKSGRKINFIRVDVTKEDLAEQRSLRIKDLLCPSVTVLDDSIGCALWFACRAHGSGSDSSGSPARVMLLGMGADEQLGGYSRHRARFQQEGHQGLLQEISLEMSRIADRNLGRDNRVASDHGVAPRLPYLDEEVVAFLNSLPLGLKMDLRLGRGLGEKLLLRGAAFRLGFRASAFNQKRAIQFGSKIAKLENRKEKASDLAIR